MTKTKKRKRKTSFTAGDVRNAIFIAACEAHANGALGYQKAEQMTGIARAIIFQWVKKFPKILEEIKPEVEAYRAKRDDQLKENYLRIALLGSAETVFRLETNPGVIPFRDITGAIDYATKNYRLLSGKPTDNLGGDVAINLTETLILKLHEMEKAERLKDINDTKNRLRDYDPDQN